MKKLLVGILCCVGLLMFTIASEMHLTEGEKPKITSIDKFI